MNINLIIDSKTISMQEVEQIDNVIFLKSNIVECDSDIYQVSEGDFHSFNTYYITSSDVVNFLVEKNDCFFTPRIIKITDSNTWDESEMDIEFKAKSLEDCFTNRMLRLHGESYNFRYSDISVREPNTSLSYIKGEISNEYLNKTYSAFFLGRYFTKTSRHTNLNPYASRLLKSKSSGQKFYKGLLEDFLEYNQKQYDYIICIPPRSHCRENDRFDLIDSDRVLVLSEEYDSIKNVGSFHNKFDVVKGKFAISDEIVLEDKSILLVDDIYTDGATLSSAIIEIEKELVKNIEVLCYGRTSHITRDTGEEKFFCNKCKGELKTRFNGKGELFLGCNNFYSDESCTFTCDFVFLFSNELDSEVSKSENQQLIELFNNSNFN